MFVFSKVTGFQPETFLKDQTCHWYFPNSITCFPRTLFFITLPNGCFCKPHSKSLILLKRLQGSNYHLFFLSRFFFHGAITNNVSKFRKINGFQSSWIVMNCQCVVYSHAKSVYFVSSYSPYTLMNSLKKSSLCSLQLQNVTQATKTHKHTLAARQRKLEMSSIISNYNFKYPVMSKVTVF